MKWLDFLVVAIPAAIWLWNRAGRKNERKREIRAFRARLVNLKLL